MHEVGALLEAKGVHPGRTARDHLLGMAATTGIPENGSTRCWDWSVDGGRPKAVGAFSLGMGQRLGIAAALLGDPAVVMLDEPVNGFDPEGVRWIRYLLQDLAAQGQDGLCVLAPDERDGASPQSISLLSVVGD